MTYANVHRCRPKQDEAKLPYQGHWHKEKLCAHSFGLRAATVPWQWTKAGSIWPCPEHFHYSSAFLCSAFPLSGCGVFFSTWTSLLGYLLCQYLMLLLPEVCYTGQILLRFYFFLIILCVLVFWLHVCLCTVYTPGTVPEDRKGVRWSGTEGTDSCKAMCGSWELNPGPLLKQPVLLTTNPSLQPSNPVLISQNLLNLY